MVKQVAGQRGAAASSGQCGAGRSARCCRFLDCLAEGRRKVAAAGCSGDGGNGLGPGLRARGKREKASSARNKRRSQRAVRLIIL